MLTLKRFRALTGSYGADLRRWPSDLRGPAEARLRASETARAAWRDAQALDAALRAPGAPDATALARLRAAVAARLAAAPPGSGRRRGWRAHPSGRPSIQLSGKPAATRAYWAGLATGGACLVAAGLLIGAAYPPAAESTGLLAALQPSPLPGLADPR